MLYLLILLVYLSLARTLAQTQPEIRDHALQVWRWSQIARPATVQWTFGICMSEESLCSVSVLQQISMIRSQRGQAWQYDR